MSAVTFRQCFVRFSGVECDRNTTLRLGRVATAFRMPVSGPTTTSAPSATAHAPRMSVAPQLPISRLVGP